MRIEVWSDVICPWCYLGAARLDHALDLIGDRDDVEVIHRSFELDPGRSRTDTEPVAAMLRARFGAQGPGMDQQVAALAASEGLAYRTDRQVGSTLDAHRLLHLAREREVQPALLRLLFEANFAEARSIFAAETLLALGVQAGLDADEVTDVLNEPTRYLDAVRADEARASALGANGVPFLLINEQQTLQGAQSAEATADALRAARTRQVHGRS